MNRCFFNRWFCINFFDQLCSFKVAFNLQGSQKFFVNNCSVHKTNICFITLNFIIFKLFSEFWNSWRNINENFYDWPFLKIFHVAVLYAYVELFFSKELFCFFLICFFYEEVWSCFIYREEGFAIFQSSIKIEICLIVFDSVGWID